MLSAPAPSGPSPDSPPLNIRACAADRNAMVRRRKEDRSLCAELLEIRWKDKGVDHDALVTLEDISSAGLCLGTEIPIAPETKLVIKYPKGKYEGQVKYCKSDELGYLVGVEFDPGYTWSRRQFRPSHLLQFRLHAVKKDED